MRIQKLCWTLAGLVLAFGRVFLAVGSNSLGCSASELTTALDQFNNQFDVVGQVVACDAQDPLFPATSGATVAVTSPGVFTCPIP